MATSDASIECPKCGKSYGINVRKDKSIRCKLCGYEGGAYATVPQIISK